MKNQNRKKKAETLKDKNIMDSFVLPTEILVILEEQGQVVLLIDGKDYLLKRIKKEGDK